MTDESDPVPTEPEYGPMPCRKCGGPTDIGDRILIFHLPAGTTEAECPRCYYRVKSP